MKLTRTDALLVVDLQPTFMPGGGLAVPKGDEILAVVAKLVNMPFPHRYASRDVHPWGHISLASSYRSNGAEVPPFSQIHIANMDEFELADHSVFSRDELRSYLLRVGTQTLWPDHAVMGTNESQLHDALDTSEMLIFQKGINPCFDSNSAIHDNAGDETWLAKHLRSLLQAQIITRVFVCGLAFEYCAGWTARGLRQLGFDVVYVMDATKSLTEDGERAMIEELKSLGVHLCESSDLIVE